MKLTEDCNGKAHGCGKDFRWLLASLCPHVRLRSRGRPVQVTKGVVRIQRVSLSRTGVRE